MGCGSSSLKGDDVPNVNSQPVTAAPPGAQPMKKVQTNFSDVNYEQDAHKRRMTEYAPHEQPAPAPIREESRDDTAQQVAGDAYGQQPQNEHGGILPDRPDQNAGTTTEFPHEGLGSGTKAASDEPVDTTLKPYQTFDGGDWDQQENNRPSQPQVPYLNGTQDEPDPTSNYAKDRFATDNDPANPLNQESHHQSQTQQQHQNQNLDPSNPNSNAQIPDIQSEGDGEHKKSWLGQKYANFQTTKRGSGPSDENVMKYTGKDKKELGEWARDRPDVGGGQNSGRAGTDNGLAVGAAWN